MEVRNLLFAILIWSRNVYCDEIGDINGVQEAEHIFESILELTGASGTKMDANALRNLLNNFNETCLTPDIVLDIAGTDVQGQLNETEFMRVSPLFVYYMNNETCQGSRPTLEAAMNGLLRNNGLCYERLTDIITSITNNEEYEESCKNTFGAGKILAKSCLSDPLQIGYAFGSVLKSVIKVECALPSVRWFKEGVLNYYNKTENATISETEFNVLLAKLKIGTKAGQVSSHEGHRRRRSVDDHDDEKKCYSSDDIISMVGGKWRFPLSKLLETCPIIMQQVLTDSCVGETAKTIKPATGVYTSAMKYGYGTASVAIISILAFGGLLVFPSIGTSGYKLVMQFFIALGVGSLSGDALLHLIPEVVGLHGHEEGASTGGESKAYIWRLLVVVVAIYAFYFFENMLRLWNEVRGTNISFHQHDDDGHNHGHAHHESGHANHDHGDHNHESAGNRNDTNSNHVIRNGIVASQELKQDDDEVKKEVGELKHQTSRDLLTESGKKTTFCFGLTPVGVMVLIGDILHNFGDGLALGVAFSSGWIGGVGASLAIFCHELPHEFGDFAIYLKNGMTKWQALGMNFVAACFGFIGLYIGLSVATNTAARQWMLAAIAGMFLYISLVDVMHEMTGERSDRPILQFIVQNIGMILGWTILLLLAVYEDNIKKALGG